MNADRVGGRGRAKGNSSKVSEERDRPVRLGVRAEEFSRSDILESIGEEVGVRVAEDEGTELGDGDESTEVEDLAVGVSTIHDTAEVEHLGSVVHLGPESVLEARLLGFEGSGRLDEVEMCEDCDELGETVRRERREGFERFLRARRQLTKQDGGHCDEPSRIHNFHQSSTGPDLRPWPCQSSIRGRSGIR